MGTRLVLSSFISPSLNVLASRAVPAIRTVSRGLHAKVWRTNGDFPENSLESLKGKKSIGLAFSGGGTRSATATFGQLAALDKIGLMDRVKYISAVSGGGWATTPYTFLPAHISDQAFFGDFEEDPRKFTPERLNHLAKSSFAQTLSESTLIDNFLRHAVKLAGDETFARAVGDVFLRSVGLNNLKRAFSFNEATRKESDESLSYYIAKEKRPFLILGATLLTQDHGKVPIEYTPLYTGVRHHFEKGNRSVGGCYVNSYAYDSLAPREVFPAGTDETTVNVTPSSRRNVFTLSDIVGSTGAAPQEVIHKIGMGFLGFPEFEHWGLKPGGAGFCPSREIPHGDGGLLENLGVMPLFARQTRRIIVFMNTKNPFSYAAEDDNNFEISPSIQPLFESVKNKENDEQFTKNVVLEGGREKFLELVRALMKKRASGETLIHTDMYRVKENSHYGIEGGYNARITWVYNSRVDNLRELLPLGVKSKLSLASEGKEGKGEFANFPYYATFFQNPPSVTDLTQREVNLLSHYSYWNVTHNREEILQ